MSGMVFSAGVSAGVAGPVSSGETMSRTGSSTTVAGTGPSSFASTVAFTYSDPTIKILLTASTSFILFTCWEAPAL